MQPRILILYGHPAPHKSKVNKTLMMAIRNHPSVTFHDLYREYPDLHIDVAREQQLVKDHDILLFQHPFYWYSVPAVFKEWFDLVLEYGFAYGEKGTHLKGKAWIHVITTGGPAEAYGPEGYNKFTVEQLLSPIIQTANLCGMTFLKPLMIHSALKLNRETLLAPYIEKYQNLLTQLADYKGSWESFSFKGEL